MKKYPKDALYREIVNFCTVTLEDPEDCFVVEAHLRGAIGGLVRKARKAIPADDDMKEKIHKLLQLMYGDWGFSCDPDSYFDAQNLFLPMVINSKQGMPVTLGAILLYLADKLDLPIYPVMFPTQLILRADVDGETAFINPWNGEYISQEELGKWYQGAWGYGAKLSADELEIADPKALKDRFADLAKHTLIREDLNEPALRYIENRLIFHPDDPYERRDRGLVLAQIGAYQAALNDLEFFIKKCPEDPTTFLLTPRLAELKKHLKQDLLH